MWVSQNPYSTILSYRVRNELLCSPNQAVIEKRSIRNQCMCHRIHIVLTLMCHMDKVMSGPVCSPDPSDIWSGT